MHVTMRKMALRELEKETRREGLTEEELKGLISKPDIPEGLKSKIRVFNYMYMVSESLEERRKGLFP